MAKNFKVKRRFINKSEVPPLFHAGSEESPSKRDITQSYRLPKIFSPTLSSMKTITSTHSRSTSHSTHNLLHPSLSADLSPSNNSSFQFLPMQMFKKKNLWLLIPQMLRVKDFRQSLSTMDILLDSLRENLVIANLISDMPAKKDIEIIHDKISTCFRTIQTKLQSCSGAEIFTWKFLSEFRFSIQPLNTLFLQYPDAMNGVKKFLGSLSELSIMNDKETLECIPNCTTSNVKSLATSIIAEHARLVSMMDQMKFLVRHSSHKLRPLINAASDDKIRQDLEKLATRAVKFYEKTYQELSFITRVSQKELQNYLFQMESELAFVSSHYRRYLHVSTEISKMIPKQERYLDVCARVKELQEQVINSHQIFINKNTQVPMLEIVSPNSEPSVLLDKLKQLKGEIVSLKKSLASDKPTEDTTLLVNQLYELTRRNREMIYESERIINKSNKILKTFDFLKKLSSLLQDLSFKTRTLQDEVEVLFNEDDTEPGLFDQKVKQVAAKRNEIRYELLYYYCQISSQVTKVQNSHPELEKYTKFFEQVTIKYIQKAEDLALRLCDQNEDSETISSFEFYQNVRIILKEESKYFPNFLNNQDLLSLVDDMLNAANPKITKRLRRDHEVGCFEDELLFFDDLADNLTYLKTLFEIFKPFTEKYFIEPEERLEYFEEFSSETSELRVRVEHICENSKLDWEVISIVKEQLRYIEAAEEYIKLIGSISQLLSLDVLANEKSFQTLLTSYYQYLNSWAKFETSFNNHSMYSSLLFRFHEKIVQTVGILQLLRAMLENKDYSLTVEEATKISKFLEADTSLFDELLPIKELIEYINTFLVISSETSEHVNSIVFLWYQKHQIDFDRIKSTAEKNENVADKTTKNLEEFNSKYTHIDTNQAMLSRLTKYTIESQFLSIFIKIAGMKSEYNKLEESSWELIVAEKSISALKANLFQHLDEIRLKLKKGRKSPNHDYETLSEVQTVSAEYLKNLLELQAAELQNEIEFGLSENGSPVQECLQIMQADANFVSKFYGLIWKKMVKREIVPAEIQNIARKYGLLLTVSGKSFYRTSSKAYIGKVLATLEIGGIKYSYKVEEFVKITRESKKKFQFE
mgnify:CR=1 FL=1